MEKDTRLVNIYLKIHSKRPITMDDLAYLAQHDPECFEKTCKNVVYNMPVTKPVMEPIASKAQDINWESDPYIGNHIDVVLDNLKNLETNDLLVADLDVEEVKNLLGNLYMELLFPHNGEESFFDVANLGNVPLFDKKA